MKNWQSKIINFMYGRYGIDSLNKFLIAVILVLYILDLFIKGPVVSIISIIFIVLFWFRFMSKDHYKRQKENIKFLNFYNPVYTKITSFKLINLLRQKIKYRNTHKIYLCKCGKLIRVPKNKGKIEVTCPTCGKQKIHRT